ncbi:MAG: hypothetical protein KDA42_06500 [Planctomycetales bacterium]|nr:hypothetical protein [Planctomycetales bacterium]
MSRREFRAQQAALIIFATLNIVLGATCFWLYPEYQYARKTAAAEAAVAAKQVEITRQAQAEIDQLKQIIGHAALAPIDEIESAHRQDSALVVSNGAEAVLRPYRRLVEALWITARSVLAREKAAREQVDQLAGALSTMEEGHRLVESRFDENTHALEERLRAERDDFAAARSRHEHQTRELGQLVDEKSRAVIEWQESYRQMERRLARQLASLQHDYNRVVEKIRDFENVEFEKPDGRVSASDPHSDRIVIDLGSEDLLRVGISFAVFPPGDGRLGTHRKGTIEVTKILAEHVAEARVVNDSLTDPILSGDLIYTPLWQPGQRRHFALVGPLDIDADGRDDRDLVARLIERSGGVIDEELTAAGDRQGGMTIDTRFLVIGRVPSESNARREFMETYGQMIERADQLAVERISLTKLLDLVGYRTQSRASSPRRQSNRSTR